MRSPCAFIFAALILVGGAAAAQLPPGAPPPAQTAPPASADTRQGEVQAFYASYWKAWEEADYAGVSVHLAPDFAGSLFVPGKGVVTLDAEQNLAGVRQFFASLSGRRASWGRSILALEPRGAAEAVVVLRNEFVLPGVLREVEVTIEVLEKGSDGRWRLLRKWSEKIS